MTRTRLGLLGLCAVVFGIMAFGASAAQAETGAKWLVNGTDAASLPASIDGSIENSKATLLTKILGALVHISCTGGKLINVKLEANGSLTNGGKVRFTGCSVTISGESAPECEVHSAGSGVGTVETNAGKGLIVLHEGSPLTRLEPSSGTTFVTLQMGEACPIGESVPVQGKLFVKDCENAFKTAQVNHLIEEGPLTSLTALGNPATIDGSATVFLTGAHVGLSWSGDPA